MGLDTGQGHRPGSEPAASRRRHASPSGPDPARPDVPESAPIGSPSRLGPLLVAALGVAIVAFGLGYRLGQGPSAEGPAMPSQPAPSSSPSPLDLRAAVVSERLEEAYRLAGGEWQLCSLDPTPACEPQNRQLSGPLPDPDLLAPSTTPIDWEALGPRVVRGPDVVLVADLGTDVAIAYLAGPLSDTGSSATKARLTTIAWHGAVYVDLRALRTGRYTLVIGGLAFGPRPAEPGPPRSPVTATWWTYEAAFEVR